jgi:hypothetical protein
MEFMKIAVFAAFFNILLILYHAAQTNQDCKL